MFTDQNSSGFLIQIKQNTYKNFKNEHNPKCLPWVINL